MHYGCYLHMLFIYIEYISANKKYRILLHRMQDLWKHGVERRWPGDEGKRRGRGDGRRAQGFHYAEQMNSSRVSYSVVPMARLRIF